MKEELVELITTKRKEIEKSTFNNEDETKNGLILPVLYKLGWDVFDTNEVTPEYGIEGKRVDYCLNVKKKPKIFIEVKKTTENIQKHQKQLLEYSFSRGIELSVLTNGVLWWFYLSSIPVPWEKKIYCEVDVTQDRITDVVENFIKYLSKDRVSTNESIKLAKETYDKKSKNQTVEDTIPRVWNEIITDLIENKEKSVLYDLISDEVIEECQITPQPQNVFDFIQLNREKFTVDEKPITKYSKKQKANTINSYTGKKVTSFTLKGETRNVKTWKDVLVGLCEIIHGEHTKDFKKVFEIKGNKNPYFVKKKEQVVSPRSISDSGIYVETNLSSNGTMKMCDRLLSLFGHSINDLELEYDTEMTIGSVDKKLTSIKNKEDTSSLVINKIEKKFKEKLIESGVKGGRNKYFRTTDKTKSFLILTSKRYDNGKKGFGFWFSLRRNQIKFLTKNQPSYLVLVCGSDKALFVQNWNDFKPNLNSMNSSGEGNKMYYHIKIFERDNQHTLGLPDVGNSTEITGLFI